MPTLVSRAITWLVHFANLWEAASLICQRKKFDLSFFAEVSERERKLQAAFWRTARRSSRIGKPNESETMAAAKEISVDGATIIFFIFFFLDGIFTVV